MQPISNKHVDNNVVVCYLQVPPLGCGAAGEGDLACSGRHLVYMVCMVADDLGLELLWFLLS